MKRPFVFKLIVGWFCFALLIQTGALARFLIAKATVDSLRAEWSVLPLALLAFVVWQTIGLFQLKRLSRTIAIVFFTLWSLWMLGHFVFFAVHGLASPVLTLFFISFTTLNLLCVWYLSRRQFRDFAGEFEQETHSRLMQKAAQKKVSDELKK